MSHQLETIIGYKFKNPKLLETALTHTSYATRAARRCRHNERLEFLGDSVLSSRGGRIPVHAQNMPEGELTRMRVQPCVRGGAV